MNRSQLRRINVTHTCPECGANVGASFVIGLTDPDPVVTFPHDPATGKHPPQITGNSAAAQARRSGRIVAGGEIVQ